jgi:hypothetical protein
MIQSVLLAAWCQSGAARVKERTHDEQIPYRIGNVGPKTDKGCS